ncbi:hypothetical protein COCC4DRAFT_188463 [Bipolaris maydis ATCC 48331]|uniref:F-box domain-containing protein n=2 Tax=Cochliobolus heterostrophus TaxID=5016 RepID=M2UUE5_COCH5|nr:uncharacterized protein COCC4DRAFT_188463 [Bipolaris maydis ATCC 48331]EMD91478.1 hypothetical protein COCHEDRAFT_1175448 [Bipolaris maydis C5]KAH7559317.1 hypothetical protein BM1_04254 [Bipolaris maydis]ENI08764.1 hypothetical protein COCC4DRAFT_188463 [Bipolaris maydis ATCC 48331]KAJ5027342.1 hypothetical protein J3E73DRAFT_381100 [Bipolaris maydis]KAJ6270760.1 hypothetical protein PSV08DRAFT_409806 [Bipolaris maydis]
MPRLDTLPPELLFHILSYTDPPYCLSLTTYPLNALAATNRHLHAIVEEYARNLLQRHAGGVEVPKNARVSSCRRKWLGELCWFCKRKSRRKACFGRGMTCCLGCDRKEFAKMTMTQATQQTHLSKFDLFTPSPLHPNLPPLATGSYPVMGDVATMISTPDVMARSAYIRSLLGEKAQDEAFMRRRAAAHTRIMKHMNMDYHQGKGWLAYREMTKKGPKSMQTKESRRKYIEEGLKKEWEALGVEPYEHVLARVNGQLMGWVRSAVPSEEDGRGESREAPIEIE